MFSLSSQSIDHWFSATLFFCCVSKRPKRFFNVTRWRDHLSSGEKRAGCADFVTVPLRTFLSV